MYFEIHSVKWKYIFLLVLVQVYSLGEFLHQGSHISTQPLSTGTSLQCCHLVRSGCISFLNYKIKQIFILKLMTRNYSKCSMAESIDTYKNLTTYLHKNTSTEQTITCHRSSLSPTSVDPEIFSRGLGYLSFLKGGGGARHIFGNFTM